MHFYLNFFFGQKFHWRLYIAIPILADNIFKCIFKFFFSPEVSLKIIHFNTHLQCQPFCSGVNASNFQINFRSYPGTVYWCMYQSSVSQCRLFQQLSPEKCKAGLWNCLVAPVFRKNSMIRLYKIWDYATIFMVTCRHLKVRCENLISHFFIHHQILYVLQDLHLKHCFNKSNIWNYNVTQMSIPMQLQYVEV